MLNCDFYIAILENILICAKKKKKKKKRNSPDTFKNVICKTTKCVNKLYIYIYMKDLAIKNQQSLIRQETHPMPISHQNL